MRPPHETVLQWLKSREGALPAIEIPIDLEDNETRCMWCNDTPDEGRFDFLLELV